VEHHENIKHPAYGLATRQEMCWTPVVQLDGSRPPQVGLPSNRREVPLTTTTALRPRLRASSLAALASVPLLVLGLAACSSAEDDSASGSGVKTDSQIASDALAWDVANAECLRGEGFDVPDPSADGSRPGMSADIDLDAFATASGKCDAKVQGDLGPRPVTASEKKAQQEGEAEVRKTNECLRGKGFDVTDPGAGGSGASGGLESVPDDALKACGVEGGGNSVVVER